MKRLAVILALVLGCAGTEPDPQITYRMVDFRADVYGSVYVTYDTAANTARLDLIGRTHGSARIRGEWWARSSSNYGTYVLNVLGVDLLGTWATFGDTLRFTAGDVTDYWIGVTPWVWEGGGLAGRYDAPGVYWEARFVR